MTTAAWPAGVSFIAHPESYRETGPLANVIRTPMENGPVKSRRRFTAAPRNVSGTTDIMTNAQIATFETWFRDTISDGALPFTAVNPRTGETQTYRFVETYDVVHIDDDKERLSLTLERLP